jgi:ParB family chromosome partitioning protein
MKATHQSEVRSIPIDQIIVVNHRDRGAIKFRQIADNIRRNGLKRPITVVENPERNGHPSYLLVCGEGRMESYKLAGQAEVPAIVIEATKEDVLLMSLAENIARRQRSAAEMILEIGKLKERGYSYAEIAKKVDLDDSYVAGIVKLVKKGEERLLQAVLRDQIPVYLAVTIAAADDKEIQSALTDAYEKNTLRGKALIRARRLIESRRTHGKSIRSGPRIKAPTDVTANQLLKVYEKETLRQKLVVQKARICETRLLFVVSAMKQLLVDEHFVTILRAEGLFSLPKFIESQVQGRGK